MTTDRQHQGWAARPTATASSTSTTQPTGKLVNAFPFVKKITWARAST
jgi:hypothetical protein